MPTLDGRPLSVVAIQMRLVDGLGGQKVWARESIYPYDPRLRVNKKIEAKVQPGHHAVA